MPAWSRSLVRFPILSACIGLLAAPAEAQVQPLINATKSDGTAVLRLDDSGRFAVRGETFTAGIYAIAPRLLWYPAQAAFRVGGISEGSAVWDPANIGDLSVAMGNGTTASGYASTAMGNGTTASGFASTAMGSATTASAQNSTAMGGGTTASADASTAMGNGTTASGYASTAMGTGTTASGYASTAMGILATASSYYSIAMGDNTTASGENSTAMGRRASTNGHRGSFVYGDRSSTSNVQNTAENQFMVRAAGGTVFYTNADLEAGVSLAPNAGAWANLSDRARKEGFRDLDGEAVLQKIAAMPIPEWNYRAQGAATRHVGPMAQDFRAAFGLGEDDLTITTSDISGINMLAVQALERRTADLEEVRAELQAARAELRDTRDAMGEARAEIAALRTDRAAAEQRMARLEAAVQRLATGAGQGDRSEAGVGGIRR